MLIERGPDQRETTTVQDHMLRRYAPPTSNMASVSWPREQDLTAVISSSNRLPCATAVLRTASSAAVAVSFFYDSSRALYRIISVEGTKAVINSTITPNMTFTKTSQKFGQWSDVRANTVYGLGFGSEGELNKFIEKFAEVKEATSRAGGGKANGGGTGTTPTTSANASPVTGRADKHNDNVEPQHFPHPNQSDAVNSNLLKTQLNLGNDSPKKVVDKGPAPNPPLTGEAQLKYENDRLKLALAQSSANAKKWEVSTEKFYPQKIFQLLFSRLSCQH